MLRSVDKIIKAARECFFQHGYSATNVSLIGRYAGISRATIYKNFSSKEALFQAMVQRQFEQYQAGLDSYTASSGDFWQETEALFIGRCQGVFDEIDSQIIRTELIHAGHSHCQTLISCERERMHHALAQRLEKEIAAGRLSLAKVDMTPILFAQVMHSIPIGVVFSSTEETNIEMIKKMLHIFKVSTQVS